MIVFRFTSIQVQGICPCRQQPLDLIHNSYQRGLADLPGAGNAVVLDMSVRKFFCPAPNSPRKVFCQRVNPMAAPYARHTQRLHQEQHWLGLELSGVVGARTARRQGMTGSETTILRQVRRTAQSVLPTLSKLGVDDWAFRKRKSYGSLLVDLERHRPVDLVADRSSATLGRWLQEHPGVKMITRDRAKDSFGGALQLPTLRCNTNIYKFCFK